MGELPAGAVAVSIEPADTGTRDQAMPRPPDGAGGRVSEDWAATILGIALLGLALVGVIQKGMIP